ncbi:MAG: MBOAT family protein [Erysipelotrichaceae bacterium]|nr:MBOAT family protein [Erysipelotrichaceae bacterium]
MTIVSLPFFILVAATVLCYYIVPKKYRWLVLLAASGLFYWFNSGILLLVLVTTSLVTFLIGLWIAKIQEAQQKHLDDHPDLSREEKKKEKEAAKKRTKRVLLLGILLVLGALLVLKYANFFIDNFNSLAAAVHAEGTLPRLNLLLPLGISFYTLQAIAYMTDVYRGKQKADRDPVRFLLFMSFFPQIVQGPIPRYGQLASQLYEGHEFDYKKLTFGVQLMLWGLMKKIVLADRLAMPANQLFGHYENYNGPILFVGSLLYGLQVYCDFSGGMDIARGVAQMLGIDLEKNFDQPYFASSIEDFWRRWHMTMGSWMKDYVFYPLSLSKTFTNLGRKSRKVFGTFVGKRLPSFLAMFIVYFLVGFWHGPNWKYVAFGLWNGLFIMFGILMENVYKKAREKCGIDEGSISWRVFRMVRTLFVVTLGRYFSRADDFTSAVQMLKRTFINWWDLSFLTEGKLLNMGLNNANWYLLLAMILLLFFVDLQHERGISFREVIARQSLIFRWGIYIGTVLFLLIFGLYGPAYDAAAFIYGQF